MTKMQETNPEDKQTDPS